MLSILSLTLIISANRFGLAVIEHQGQRATEDSAWLTSVRDYSRKTAVHRNNVALGTCPCSYCQLEFIRGAGGPSYGG
jgi:hypothetical protein